MLGALLLDNASAVRVDGKLSVDDFYSHAHRVLFKAILDLIASDKTADLVTLAEALKSTEELDYVGGADYLGTLIENVPTAANIRHYAEIVSEHARKRRAAAMCLEFADRAMAPAGEAAFTLIDDMRERLGSLAVDMNVAARWPTPMDLVALAARGVPEREFIVGMIAPKHKPGGIFGHGGAAKTQLAIALGICFAARLPFFGEPVAGAIAAHVSTEEDALELQIRVARQCGVFGLELSALDARLLLYDFTAIDPTLVAIDGDGNVVPTQLYGRLKDELQQRYVEVLTLDNLATLCAVDLIKPGHATRAIALLQALLPDGTVIMLGHVDKATARAGYGKEAYSGTAAIHNRLRWRWYLFAPARADDAEPGEETPEDDGRRVLEVQKNNAGRSGQRLTLRIRSEDGALIADGIESGVVASIQRSNERKAVLQALKEAAARDVPVPTATTNRATAHEALEAMPSFPEALRGRTGKRRLFRLLMQMRADRELEVCEFKTAGRKSREGYRLARIATEQK